MRILIFLPSVERGGCEQAALNLAEALRALGNETLVCHPQVSRTISLRDSFQSLGCQYVRWRCGERSFSTWPADEDQYDEATLLLLETDPDIVVLVLPEPTSAFGFLLACLESKKRSFVVFQLCDESFRVPQSILDAVAALPVDHSPTFISVARQAVTLLANGFKMAESDIQVLPNFSGDHLFDRSSGARPNIERRARSPQNKRTVLTVGRITRQKGYEYLVQAASLVTRFLPDAHFLWVGEGEDDLLFRQQIEMHGRSKHFTLTGWVDRVEQYLLSADVFVLPSLWEGTPLSISEAMASGCPIIATAVGGIPEMLNAAEGWLVEPANPVALQKSIRIALENPLLSRRKAAMARVRWAHDFEENRKQLVRLITS